MQKAYGGRLTRREDPVRIGFLGSAPRGAYSPPLRMMPPHLLVLFLFLISTSMHRRPIFTQELYPRASEEKEGRRGRRRDGS